MDTVTAETFDTKVMQAAKPVVVDIWAEWCGPCRMQSPLFEEAAKQLGDKANLLKLDADENQKLVKEYKVLGIPTMLYFSHGRLVKKKTGVQSTEAIVKETLKLADYSADDAEHKEVKGWFRNPFRRRK